MKYLVLTPWDGRNEHYLEECIESVKKSSGNLGVVHTVIRCDHTWEETMFAHRNDAEYVAYVDADDIVYGNAIQRVFRTLEENDVAVAFTSEQRIDENGNLIKVLPHAKSVKDVVTNPASMHHLVAFRKGCIDEEPMRVYRKFANFESKNRGCPLDWLMRARAAATGGMIHVPMVGYGYRDHNSAITRDREFLINFTTQFSNISKEISSWLIEENLPTF